MKIRRNRHYRDLKSSILISRNSCRKTGLSVYTLLGRKSATVLCEYRRAVAFFWIFKLAKIMLHIFTFCRNVPFLFAGDWSNMSSKMTREDCLLLIQQKTNELGRFPKKSDFDNDIVSMIKSYFGPWPRALEAAGIKEPNYEKIEQKREKRRRAKENQIRYRKEHSKEEKRE